MHFQLSDDQSRLRRNVEAFCRQHCSESSARDLDANSRFPERLHSAMAEAGILGHCLPSEYGGRDGRMVDAALITEVLAGASDAAANLLFVNFICAALVTQCGTPEQRRKFVTGAADGSLRLAFALTEKEAGSDAGNLQCRAERSADAYVLNGGKWYTTGAAAADFILTVALTDPEAGAKRGASMFLVPSDAAGLDIQPMNKIAGNAIASCSLTFDNVRVPPCSLLGPQNRAWQPLMIGAGLERLLVAAACFGRAQRVLEEIVEFARERTQFAQPIGSFQAIQHQVADLATSVEAMRWLVYSTAWRLETGQMPIKEICMAKLFCAERLNEIVNRGMRIFGGRGYLTEYSMQRHLRESFLGLYAGGTAEIQRNIIAGQLRL
jgi:alkylation response protein AidB-like acyl-CoA dehydrogenase